MIARQLRWVVLPLCGFVFACSGGCSCRSRNSASLTTDADHEHDANEAVELDAEGDVLIGDPDNITDVSDGDPDNITCTPRSPCMLSHPPVDNASWGISVSEGRAAFVNSSTEWTTEQINGALTIVVLNLFQSYRAASRCPEVQGAEYVFLAFPCLFGDSVAYLCSHEHDDNGNLRIVDTRIALFSSNNEDVVFVPTTDVGPKYDIQLSDHYLIWRFGFNLRAYDKNNHSVFTFASEPDDYGYEPNLDGSHVVFVRGGEKDQEVWLADLGTGQKTRITDDDVLQKWPNISGDRIVWVDIRDGEWYPDATYSNSNLYLHSLSSGETVRITDDTRDQEDPWIDGDLVVWTDLRHGGRTATFGYDEAEIYLKDLRTDQEYRVTNMPGNDFQPQISGTAVIWLHETVPGDRWSHDLYYIDVAYLLEDPADGG